MRGRTSLGTRTSSPRLGDKIFVFLGAGKAGVGVKLGNNRDEADEWLLRYPEDAQKMAYIGRSGWNSLRADGAIPEDEIRAAIDESYDRIVRKLPKKSRPDPDLSDLEHQRLFRLGNVVQERVEEEDQTRHLQCLLDADSQFPGEAVVADGTK